MDPPDGPGSQGQVAGAGVASHQETVHQDEGALFPDLVRRAGLPPGQHGHSGRVIA